MSSFIVLIVFVNLLLFPLTQLIHHPFFLLFSLSEFFVLDIFLLQLAKSLTNLMFFICNTIYLCFVVGLH